MPQAHNAAEASQAGKAMSHARWSREPNRVAALAPAREGLLRKFLLQVDPDGVLPPAERARRAESARKAFYADLTRRSLAARRARKAAAEPFDKAPVPTTGHRDGCQLPEDHRGECRRASNPNYGGRS